LIAANRPVLSPPYLQSTPMREERMHDIVHRINTSADEHVGRLTPQSELKPLAPATPTMATPAIVCAAVGGFAAGYAAAED
jgi:hypothetical protein